MRAEGKFASPTLRRYTRTMPKYDTQLEAEVVYWMERTTGAPTSRKTLLLRARARTLRPACACA